MCRMRRCAGLALLSASGLMTSCATEHVAHRLAGRALFAQACSACHSLSGASTPSRQGGDLLGLRLSPAVMLQFAREMPVRRPLRPSELTAVVQYVVSVERRDH